MAKKLEEQLAELGAHEADIHGDAAASALRKALGGRSNILAAKAASMIGAAELDGFEDELVAAFDRMLDQPVKRDKGCKGKTAVAEALYSTSAHVPELYERGATHVQLEPVWGGSEDTATGLRSTCAMALAWLNDAHSMPLLADLLADAQGPVRASAAAALAHTGRAEAGWLLRLKLRMGDEDPTALGEVMASLLELDSKANLPVIVGQLESRDELTAEAAALTLGRSRLEAALPALIAWANRTLVDRHRQTAMTAIATLRIDAATDYLVEQIEDGPSTMAVHAVRALGIFHFDETLAARVKEAAEPRDERVIWDAVRETFG